MALDTQESRIVIDVRRGMLLMTIALLLAMLISLRFTIYALSGTDLSVLHPVLGIAAYVAAYLFYRQRMRWGITLLATVQLGYVYLITLVDVTALPSDSLVLSFGMLAIITVYIYCDARIVALLGIGHMLASIAVGMWVELSVEELVSTAGLIAAVTALMTAAALVRQRDRRLLDAQNQRLREGEDRLRTLFDASFESILIHDNAHVVDINRAGEDLFGYNKGEVRGKHLSDLLTQTLSIPDLESLKSGEDTPFESVGLHRSGNVFPVEVLTRAYSYYGRALHVSAVRDISHRKQLEKHLRRQIESEQLIARLSRRFADISYNTIEAEMNAAIGEIGFFTDVDHSYAVLFMRNESTVGQIYEWVATGITMDVNPIQDTPFHEWSWWMSRLRYSDQIVINEVETMPEVATRERTSLMNHDVRSVLVVPLRYQERLLGFIGMQSIRIPRRWSNEDLTTLKLIGELFVNALERSRAQMALEQSERRFALVFERNPVPVAIIAVQNDTFVDVNNSFLDLLNYMRHEVIGRTQDDLDLWLADTNGAPINRLGISGSLHNYDAKICNSEGDVLQVLVSMERITLEGQEAVMMILMDVTERRKAEEQSRQLMMERERIKILHQFINDASHDFRTPLSVIRTSLYLLEKKSAKSEKELRLGDHLDTIDLQVTRINNLLTDFSTMARLDYGDSFTFEVCNLNDIIQDSIDEQREIITNRQHVVTFTPDSTLPLMYLDPTAIQQALDNILLNAATYTDEGGQIDIITQHNHETAMVTITDNGIGIDDEDLPYIFNRFFRAERARPTALAGSGLGLSIAREVVTAHSGRIDVTSKLKEGTTFRIILPLPPHPLSHDKLGETAS